MRLFLPVLFLLTLITVGQAEAARPNILVAISDDQSYPHTSAYGFEAISTPGFDRVAKAGVLFNNAFTPAPGCSPMRAAFLTGRQIWQIENAGTHASSFPKNTFRTKNDSKTPGTSLAKLEKLGGRVTGK